MPKYEKYQKAVYISLLLVILGGSCIAINKVSYGIAGFLVWQFFSGQYHGGNYAEVNGIRLYYETYGEGPPVLVLHGGTAFIETMHYQIQALAKNHRVIAPDSRGHGRTSDSAAALSYRQMAEDMRELLSQLGINKVDIVGWSDGGNIGLFIAREEPTLVNHLVTIGSNYHFMGFDSAYGGLAPDSETFESSKMVYEWLSPEPSHWPVFFEKVMGMWKTQPTFQAEDLAVIQAKTMIMAGEFDAILTEHTQSMAAAIRGARLEILKGGDHDIAMDMYDKVNALMIDFLAD